MTTPPAARLLVVSAHAADFVWRAGGYIAAVTAAHGAAHVVCLSYGERGESPGAWKQPGMTLDRVKEIRRAEAQAAGDALGARMRFLDKGDYPLPDNEEILLELAELMRELQPEVILTHENLAALLRGADPKTITFPDLRHAHYQLLHSGEPMVARQTLISVETDKMVNSLNTMREQILRA